MINRIAQYNEILEGQEELKKEAIVGEHKTYSRDLEMFERSIKADIQYLSRSLMKGKEIRPWLLEALEKKVEGHSEIVDDLIEQQFLNKKRNN